MTPPRPLDDAEQEFSDEPLTGEDNRQVRRMLRDYDRTRWFWRTIRIWLGYFTGAIITATLASGYLRDLFKGPPK